jgi:putative transposase
MPLIKESLQGELNTYLCGILRNHQCPSIRVNTVPDHGYLLFRLASDKTLAEMVEAVKRGSSKWIKTKGFDFANFFWQHGYGAFSVSPSDVESVVKYIAGQQEHHRQVSFQDELRMLLRQHSIAFDERYLWD